LTQHGGLACRRTGRALGDQAGGIRIERTGKRIDGARGAIVSRRTSTRTDRQALAFSAPIATRWTQDRNRIHTVTALRTNRLSRSRAVVRIAPGGIIPRRHGHRILATPRTVVVHIATGVRRGIHLWRPRPFGVRRRLRQREQIRRAIVPRCTLRHQTQTETDSTSH
jgi:hypothetical protein